MPKLIKKISKKRGLPPGTLEYTGEKISKKVKITVIDYNEKNFQLKEVSKIDQELINLEKSTVRWINVDNISLKDIVEEIGNQFELHPLLLEDVMNPEQRPKVDDFERYLFITIKMLNWDQEKREILSEQVSLILGPNYVISFQERELDMFDPILERLKTRKGQIRKMGSDYLTYTLIDYIIDNYFIILENIGDIIEDMEDELITNPSPVTLQSIHNLKREIITLRKSVWPLREVINKLQRIEVPIIKNTTKIYLRDVYDHTIQIIDTIESYRDIISGMLDIYLSSISNRMNEIMKVLTIISTIFIPLTFLAGVYGMNFKYMPEIEAPLAYPLLWIIMIIITIIMVIFFRRKKWL